MQCDNTNRSSDIENMEETNAISSSNESESHAVPVQKLTISEKIFADGREVGISVLEENCDPEFLVFSSDDDTNSSLSKKKKGEKNLLQCTLCSYSTNKKSSYEKHFVVHSDAKPFACSLCSYKAKRKDILKRHILGKHSNLPLDSLECTECNFISINRNQLKKHMFKHFSGNMLDFEEHSKNHKNDVGEHSNTEDISKPLKCLMCDFETKYTFSFNRHMSKRHSDVQSLHCEECGFVTNNKNKLENHLLKCLDSNFKIISKKQSSFHMMEHSNEHRLDCEEKYIENEIDDLDKLSNTKDVKEIYKCSVCYFESKYKQNMERHISRRHTHNQTSPGSECDFVTHEKNELDCHVVECSNGIFGTVPKKLFSIHEAKLDYEKDIENEKDNSKANSRLIKCPECDFETKYTFSLKRHISRRHSGVQSLHCGEFNFVTDKLQCPEDNFKTIPKNLLNIEMLEHSSEDKSSYEENDIGNHEKITKPFKCSKCDFETKYKKNVSRHISRKHKDLQPLHCSESDSVTNEKGKVENEKDKLDCHLRECSEVNFILGPEELIVKEEYSDEEEMDFEKNDVKSQESNAGKLLST